MITVKDAGLLFRDIAGDAATNAAARVKPSQEDLAQIDRPADDNTWHESPNLSKESLKNRFNEIYKGDPKEDAKAAASQATSAAHPTGSSDPRDLASTAARDRQQGTDSGIDAQKGISNAASTLQDRVDANLDDETKEKARAKRDEYRARAKQYFSQKVPQERRDQTVWRLKVCSPRVFFFL